MSSKKPRGFNRCGVSQPGLVSIRKCQYVLARFCRSSYHLVDGSNMWSRYALLYACYIRNAE